MRKKDYNENMVVEKIDRNQRLYKAWLSGKYKSITSVGKAFKLKPEVAWRIIKRYDRITPDSA
jgi:hypothetical protein